MSQNHIVAKVKGRYTFYFFPNQNDPKENKNKTEKKKVQKKTIVLATTQGIRETQNDKNNMRPEDEDVALQFLHVIRERQKQHNDRKSVSSNDTKGDFSSNNSKGENTTSEKNFNADKYFKEMVVRNKIRSKLDKAKEKRNIMFDEMEQGIRENTPPSLLSRMGKESTHHTLSGLPFLESMDSGKGTPSADTLKSYNDGSTVHNSPARTMRRVKMKLRASHNISSVCGELRNRYEREKKKQLELLETIRQLRGINKDDFYNDIVSDTENDEILNQHVKHVTKVKAMQTERENSIEYHKTVQAHSSKDITTVPSATKDNQQTHTDNKTTKEHKPQLKQPKQIKVEATVEEINSDKNMSLLAEPQLQQPENITLEQTGHNINNDKNISLVSEQSKERPESKQNLPEDKTSTLEQDNQTEGLETGKELSDKHDDSLEQCLEVADTTENNLSTEKGTQSKSENTTDNLAKERDVNSITEQSKDKETNNDLHLPKDKETNNNLHVPKDKETSNDLQSPKDMETNNDLHLPRYMLLEKEDSIERELSPIANQLLTPDRVSSPECALSSVASTPEPNVSDNEAELDDSSTVVDESVMIKTEGCKIDSRWPKGHKLFSKPADHPMHSPRYSTDGLSCYEQPSVKLKKELTKITNIHLKQEKRSKIHEDHESWRQTLMRIAYEKEFEYLKKRSAYLSPFRKSALDTMMSLEKKNVYRKHNTSTQPYTSLIYTDMNKRITRNKKYSNNQSKLKRKTKIGNPNLLKQVLFKENNDVNEEVGRTKSGNASNDQGYDSS